MIIQRPEGNDLKIGGGMGGVSVHAKFRWCHETNYVKRDVGKEMTYGRQ